MPSTHFSLYYHFVFSTKNREPYLHNDCRGRVHQYLGGMIRGMKGIAHAVGGIEDHVHLLVTLRPTHCLSDVMLELKANSSHWISEEIGIRRFGWQEGYGVFSVSASNVDAVKRYVNSQESRHRKISFQEEYIDMLEKGMVEFDERYLW